MSFFRSIVVLLAVCLCVAFGYFVGYGLANHDFMPMVYGAVLLLMGGGLMVLLNRRDRQRHPGRMESHGWQ
jgi:hypothetical protein